MPYPNNKVDLGKIIRKGKQKNREHWKKIMDDNKKQNERKKEIYFWENKYIDCDRNFSFCINKCFSK